VIVSSLHAIELAIPMIRPFRSAATTIQDRRVVLIEVRDRAGSFGWGEAAPFPGATDDDIDAVWTSLTAGDPTSFTASARAAFDEARHDAEARNARLPLWQALGGGSAPVPASLAVGIRSDVAETVMAVAEARDAGYRAIKLKIDPERTELLSEVSRTFPGLAIGVDGNGSFRPGDADLLVSLDRWRPAYVEQPFPAGTFADSAALRRQMQAPVVLDEDIVDATSARAAISADSTDVLTVKPGRLGIDGALAVIALAVDAGLGVKVSGLIETGIGRGHSLALATLEAVVLTDLAPAQAFLETDIVDRPWTMRAGMIEPRSRPGIGVEPDPALVERFAVREMTVELSDDR
jgi:O-succinylbenzoate synthase